MSHNYIDQLYSAQDHEEDPDGFDSDSDDGSSDEDEDDAEQCGKNIGHGTSPTNAVSSHPAMPNPGSEANGPGNDEVRDNGSSTSCLTLMGQQD